MIKNFTEDRLSRLIAAIENFNQAHERYEKLLVEEIESMIGIAVAHGWETKRGEAGELARKAIIDAHESIVAVLEE